MGPSWWGIQEATRREGLTETDHVSLADGQSGETAGYRRTSPSPASCAMDILYKYVTQRRALDSIPKTGEGTLRATQPAALNDPFECAVSSLYVFQDKAEEDRELARVLTEINRSKPVTAQYVGRARRQYGSLFTRQLFAERVSTRFGVVSLSKHPSHPLMWSHYTIDGSGFVIGYKVKELERLAGPIGRLRPVTYSDQPPPIMGPNVLVSPFSNLPKLLSCKSAHWSYESEWRLIVELDETIDTGEIDRHKQPIRLVRVPNEAVASVYYTERTSRESVKLIRERLLDKNNRYAALTPRKLILSSTSYNYEEARDGHGR